MKKKPTKEKPKSKKKKTTYNKQEYASFNLSYQIPNRRDALEVDYVDKLSKKEKEWLNNFLQETVVTNFDHKGKQIIPDSLKTESYDDNNRRNRDIYSRAKSEKKLEYGYGNNTDPTEKANNVSEEKYNNTHFNYNDEEDAMLTSIEIRRNLSKIFKKGE